MKVILAFSAHIESAGSDRDMRFCLVCVCESLKINCVSGSESPNVFLPSKNGNFLKKVCIAAYKGIRSCTCMQLSIISSAMFACKACNRELKITYVVVIMQRKMPQKCILQRLKWQVYSIIKTSASLLFFSV